MPVSARTCALSQNCQELTEGDEQEIVLELVPGDPIALSTDKNGNMELDYTEIPGIPFAIPAEPLGFSQSPVLVAPPTFADIAVTIDGGEAISIEMVSYL